MKLSQEYIISEIKRTAKENNGKPLGKLRFEKETGIKESDWLGRYWARWGDAVEEAEFDRNIMIPELDEALVIEKAIEFIRELKRFPTQPELKLKRRNDPNFPSFNTFFRKLGTKHKFACKVLEFCEARGNLDDVADICRPICEARQPDVAEYGDEGEIQFGFVYLIKSGSNYKIGRSISAEKRRYEIDLKLPEKADLIHKIKTDDPVRIEAYWHKRFEDKRKRGEWFKLSSSDIKAFKRRKFM